MNAKDRRARLGTRIALTNDFKTGTGHIYKEGSQGEVRGRVNGHLVKVLMDSDNEKLGRKAPILKVLWEQVKAI